MNTNTKQTPAEALAVPVDVALADLLKFEFHFRTTGNPIVAKQIRDIHATLARAAGAVDDNHLRDPFPRVHSYDPSGARRTVTVQWGEDSFVSYVRYGDRSTWKEIPPINETPVERPAPSAGVVEFDPMLIADMLRQFADYLCQDTPGCYKLSCLREQADLIEASIGQAVTAPASAAGEAEVLAMVDRFLAWRFPEDFAPDGGISYTPLPRLPEWTHDTRPTGTNLLTAIQARAMLEYVLAAQGGSDG